MTQFLKDRMSSISSDLYEEILKPNKNHTNRIIQVIPCQTSLRVVIEPASAVKSLTSFLTSLLQTFPGNLGMPSQTIQN